MLTKLTAQARTRHELAEALRRRNVPEEVGDKVLDRMTEVGLVDDTAFAEAWVTSRQSRRHLSRTALRQELARKGVDRERIDGALEQVEPDDEYAAALALAVKKARTTRGLDLVVRRRRIAGALARRGFGSDLTRRALTEALDRDAQDTVDEGDAVGDAAAGHGEFGHGAFSGGAFGGGRIRSTTIGRGAIGRGSGDDV